MKVWEICGKEDLLPYCCEFCNKFFCSDHRLPERHNCDSLPKREWREYRVIKEEVVIEEKVVIKHFTHSKCPKCVQKKFQ